MESQLEIATSEQRRATELFPKIILAAFRIILRNIEGIDRLLATVTMDVPFRPSVCALAVIKVSTPLL